MKTRRANAHGALATAALSLTLTLLGSPEAEAANRPPSIEGTPPTSVTVGATYSFTPRASDPDDDRLNFWVRNKPRWLNFNSQTGRLYGVAPQGSQGEYGEIRIVVSDGELRDRLPKYSITVRGQGGGGDPVPSPDPEPDPSDPTTPSGPLTSIPNVPFNYTQSPGAVTRSGALPTTLRAGEILALGNQTLSDFTLNCNGTAANPAFVSGGTIRGNDDVLEVRGSWCIFVNTKFDNIQLRTSGDHLVFRNVEVTNVADKNGSSFGGSNIVVVDSEIHHNQGDDRHGVHVPSGANSIWILRNHIHHNGGDGFQACHGCSSNPPRNVYLGGNLFHSDRENAIDFKYIQNVVVSGNTIHSLVSAPADQRWCFDDGSGCGTFSSGSDGSGIVIGSDGGPRNVLITGNEIYDTRNAVRIEEGAQVRIERNNFHNVVNQCLQLDKDGYGTVYSGNTCANSGRGILQNWRENFSLTVANNTFRNVNGPAVEYESSSVYNSSTLTGNTFVDSGPVVYGRTVASGEAAINALPGAQGNQVD
ncbi:MAG: right-handed parallel beta-helix repeat-containing protein [Woeseiaceae bacterium]